MSSLDCYRKVEDSILKILRQRRMDCLFWHQYEPDQAKYCKKQTDDYFTAETNWFAKCKQFYLFSIAEYIRRVKLTGEL